MSPKHVAGPQIFASPERAPDDFVADLDHHVFYESAPKPHTLAALIACFTRDLLIWQTAGILYIFWLLNHSFDERSREQPTAME